MIVPRLLAVLSAVSLAGCIDSITPPADDQDPGFDSTTLASMDAYHAFTKVNARAYTSSIGTFPINVYAHGSTSQYAAIHPETTTTATIAPGTAIVREVLGTDGSVDKLTMMAKGPAGYNPDLGDWWFAVTDPEGNVLPDESGELQVGRLTACYGCHIPRASDDYLFGVPKSDE